VKAIREKATPKRKKPGMENKEISRSALAWDWVLTITTRDSVIGSVDVA